MNRLAVIAKLRPGVEGRAEELIEKGPPFDPSGLGFERHSVYLAGEQALFVFEGGRLDQLMHTVVNDPSSIGAFREWENLIDGMPRIAREAYHWERDTGWEGWGE
ncbi:MAG TPA: hypothetical protein VFW80_06685 [Gaiellaceae bacterium]|nr:hypothetical protein [Gaiellaceae bacterium]